MIESEIDKFVERLKSSYNFKGNIVFDDFRRHLKRFPVENKKELYQWLRDNCKYFPSVPELIKGIKIVRPHAQYESGNMQRMAIDDYANDVLMTAWGKYVRDRLDYDRVPARYPGYGFVWDILIDVNCCVQAVEEVRSDVFLCCGRSLEKYPAENSYFQHSHICANCERKIIENQNQKTEKDKIEGVF